jgi:hypothetical protein
MVRMHNAVEPASTHVGANCPHHGFALRHVEPAGIDELQDFGRQAQGRDRFTRR